MLGHEQLIYTNIGSHNCTRTALSKYLLRESYHITSMPVIRTGVIPTCRSPSPPAVASLSHGPCDCPASLSHLANNRPMHYQYFTFWPRG